MSFVAKGKRKDVQNQDKQTPHTVLQKLSPKPTRTSLKAIEFSNITTGNTAFSKKEINCQIKKGNIKCPIFHPRIVL